LSASLLDALEARLRADSGVLTLLGDSPKVWKDEAPETPQPPFVLVVRYEETEAGETEDVRPVDVTFCCYALGSDAATALGAAVRAAADTPNTSSLSSRARLTWTGGSEVACLRNGSEGPMKLPQRTAAGRVWQYDVKFRFWVAPADAIA
jgi:hypothetical protein